MGRTSYAVVDDHKVYSWHFFGQQKKSGKPDFCLIVGIIGDPNLEPSSPPPSRPPFVLPLQTSMILAPHEGCSSAASASTSSTWDTDTTLQLCPPDLCIGLVVSLSDLTGFVHLRKSGAAAEQIGQRVRAQQARENTTHYAGVSADDEEEEKVRGRRTTKSERKLDYMYDTHDVSPDSSLWKYTFPELDETCFHPGRSSPSVSVDILYDARLFPREHCSHGEQSTKRPD